MPTSESPGIPGQAADGDPLMVFDPAKREDDLRAMTLMMIGRLGMARQATHGSLAMQLRDIEQQAGVRRTL